MTTWEVGNDIAVTDVARCDNILFVLNVGQAVLRVDLKTGELLAPLAAGRDGFPLTMSVHCEGRTLYVASPKTVLGKFGPMVQAYDFDSGELRGEYPLPGDFLPRPGGHVDGDSLVMAGIWGPPDPEVRAKDYYVGHDLGLRLSLETGTVERLLQPYEMGCFGAGECPDVRLDEVVTSHGTLTIASQPTSGRVGVYENHELARVVPVSSPEFVRSGEIVDTHTGVEGRMRWTGNNSTLNRVLAFEDGFAVVHVLRTIGADWNVGVSVPVTAFMNTYAWDGTPQEQDIRLPGPAVGNVGRTVYAVDYGPDGVPSGVVRIHALPSN